MSLTAPTPTPAWKRALIALTAGLALAFGMVAPHDPMFEHDGGLKGIVVDEAAQHPEDPPHLEGSKSSYRPPCESCLLQIQTGSRLISPPAPLPDLVRGETVAVAETAALFSPAPRLGPARAPPVSPAVL